MKKMSIIGSTGSIGRNTFDSLSMIEYVEIPESLTSIDNIDFNSYPYLKEINLSNSNQYYKLVDGALLTKDGKTLIYYPKQKEGSYVVPEDVEVIGEYAFVGTSNLESISSADFFPAVYINSLKENKSLLTEVSSACTICALVSTDICATS